MSLEVCLQDELGPGERALTENVSAHGARDLLKRKLQPGHHVLLKSPREGLATEFQQHLDVMLVVRVREGLFS